MPDSRSANPHRLPLALGLLACCAPLLAAFDCNHNPQARIFPNNVEFGEVPLGGSFRFPLLLDFDTGRKQTLTVMQVTGADPDEFSIDPAIEMGDLNEDGWLYIPVIFRPIRTGPAQAVLSMTVQFDDGDRISNVQATLTANTGGPSPVAVTITPSVLASPLYQSTPSTIEFKLETSLTKGASPALQQVSVVGVDASAFDYQGAGLSGPAVFPSNALLAGSLAFAPSTLGNKTALLRVNMGPYAPDVREDAQTIGRVVEIPLEGITRTLELTPSPLQLTADPALGGAIGTLMLKNVTLVPAQITGIDLFPVSGNDQPFTAQAAASVLPVNSSVAIQVQFLPGPLPAGLYKSRIVVHTSSLGDVEGVLEGSL